MSRFNEITQWVLLILLVLHIAAVWHLTQDRDRYRDALEQCEPRPSPAETAPPPLAPAGS